MTPAIDAASLTASRSASCSRRERPEDAHEDQGRQHPGRQLGEHPARPDRRGRPARAPPRRETSTHSGSGRRTSPVGAGTPTGDATWGSAVGSVATRAPAVVVPGVVAGAVVAAAATRADVAGATRARPSRRRRGRRSRRASPGRPTCRAAGRRRGRRSRRASPGRPTCRAAGRRRGRRSRRASPGRPTPPRGRSPPWSSLASCVAGSSDRRADGRHRGRRPRRASPGRPTWRGEGAGWRSGARTGSRSAKEALPSTPARAGVTATAAPRVMRAMRRMVRVLSAESLTGTGAAGRPDEENGAPRRTDTHHRALVLVPPSTGRRPVE